MLLKVNAVQKLPQTINTKVWWYCLARNELKIKINKTPLKPRHQQVLFIHWRVNEPGTMPLLSNRTNPEHPFLVPVLDISSSNFSGSNCNCNYILFNKLPWPGAAKGPFGLQVMLPSCLLHTAEAQHCPYNCWTSSRKAVNTNFCSLWFHPTGNRIRVYRFSCRRSIHSTIDRFF